MYTVVGGCEGEGAFPLVHGLEKAMTAPVAVPLYGDQMPWFVVLGCLAFSAKR